MAALEGMDQPVMVPVQRIQQRRALAEAILGAIVDMRSTKTTKKVAQPALIPGLDAAPTPAPAKKSKYSDLTRSKMRAFIQAYADEYAVRYPGAKPEAIRNSQVIGKLALWIEHYSEERAVQLVRAYMKVDYRPIRESCHDMWLFFRHINRIAMAVDTQGDQVDWSQVFGK